MNTRRSAARRNLEHARRLLAAVPSDSLDAVKVLSTARDLIDDALNEAMAAAALDGASVRQVAHQAGVAPNTVAPRLARSEQLKGYADESGRVGNAGIERARYDAEEGRPAPAPKYTFQRRRPTTGD